MSRVAFRLADNAGKAATERWWLRYTLLWGPIAGGVMLTGWAETWGDVECMLFGVLVFCGAVLPPLIWPHESERAVPFAARASTKFVLSVVLFSFGLNYTQTPFFFDVLHMHYGFDVTWTIDRNPAFLYLVTVAYFGTYAALLGLAFRSASEKFPTLAWVLVPLAVAFVETLLNANPYMRGLYCFDDLSFALTFGTMAYGVSFIVALPMWMGIDERDEAIPLRRIFVWCAAALFADWLFLEVMRHHVAPLITTVVDDAPGLRDFVGSCLRGSP